LIDPEFGEEPMQPILQGDVIGSPVLVVKNRIFGNG
jgi:hypothetical protein